VTTPIGQQLSASPWRLAAAGIVGAVTVAVDLLLVHVRTPGVLIDPRWFLAFVPLAAYLVLARGDRHSVGLSLVPLQGWWHWCRITVFVGLLTGVLVGGLVVIAWIVYRSLGADLPVYATPPHRVADAFVGMCVSAPLLEEPIYRVAVCVPAAILLRRAGAIAVSGLLFGLLHVVAGNPGPDNLVAGFLLAWAFLKSGSIMVPLAWHSLGNLCALAIHVGTWYWLARPGA
jgi:membrane protease YdiL (CAAX protease family)